MANAAVARPSVSRSARAWHALGVLVGLLAVLALAALAVVAGHQTRYRGQVFPGTRILGVELGGMTPEQAAAALDAAFAYPREARFAFRYGERSWEATPAQLGVRLDARASADLAMQIGRLGSTAGQLNDQGYALWYHVDLAPIVAFDQAQATAFLERIAGQVNQPPADAMLRLNGTEAGHMRIAWAGTRKASGRAL